MVAMTAAEALAIVAKAREEGRRADLRGADLRRADLRRADLGGADLRGADLRRADLRRADLGGANLWDADLRGADLRDANLWGADLRRADLGGADLRGADLRGANLRGADLRDANLRDANLMGATGAGHVCLSLQGLPSGIATLYPTRDGWRMVVGCWEGTVEALEGLISIDEGWPEAEGDECAVRRPGLALLVALCRDHIGRHPDVIAELAVRWPAAGEVASA